MGSLNKASTNVRMKSGMSSSDQILALEQAERILFGAKSRCKQDISAWVENVAFQLKEAGRELMQEVEMTVNQLVMKMRENGMVHNAELLNDLDIKFVPRILQKSELGFLCHGSLLPSSFSLELLTRLSDINVGATVTLSVQSEALISHFMKKNLDFSVFSETAVSLPCHEVSGYSEGNSLQFGFSIPSPGHVTVSARLFKQHIAGSPVVIPVFASALTGLAQLGLAPLNTNQIVAVVTECDSTRVSLETGTRPDRLMFKTCQSDTAPLDTKMNVMRQPVGPGSLPGKGFVRPKICSPVGVKVDTHPQEIEAQARSKFAVGDLCFTKWDDDNVWYNGRIDKDCGLRGVEVTFVDYDISDVVQRKNIVWSREEIPDGAVVDFMEVGEKMFAVGDFGVAQWEEDGFWYNTEVVCLEHGGYSVKFTDYGNVGFVEPSQIFKEAAEIPEGEILDVHVAMILKSGEEEKVEDFGQVRNYLENLSTKWTVGNDCLARWNEDGRWYNAIVDTVFESSTPVQYVVTLIDYGYSEIVTEDDLAANVEGVPVDQLNMLDEYVQESSQVAKDETSCNLQTEVNQTIRKPLVRTNFDYCPTTLVPKCDKLAKGVDVVAKREDDQTWHRAVIHEVIVPGSLYIVKYEDIGQFGGVSPENMVIDEEDIPRGDNVGNDLVSIEIKKEMFENLDIKGPAWSVGDICIARWSNDNVWYNAKVLRVGVGRSYIVKFVDYGNEDNVVEEDLVKSAMEIPEESFVDENVDQNLEKELPKVLSEIVVTKYYEETPAPTMSINKVAPKVPRPLKPESFDQARLLAGSVSAAAVSCKVASDYIARNEFPGPGVEAVYKIPPSLQCCLCQNTCRKGMRLACDSSPVCWGCAVKEITRGHVCWKCGEKNITTDSHLLKDQVLRSFVEQFISTVKLDPAHVQALSNGLMQPMQPEKKVEVKTEPISTDQAPHGQAQSLTSPLPKKLQGVLPDDACVARFSEDDIWYNGLVSEVYGDGSALVYFIDYGNSERVKRENIVRGPADLPNGAKLDLNVQNLIPRKVATKGQILRSPTTSETLNFLSLASLGADGFVTLEAKQTLTIKDLKGPVGVTVLADGTLAVVCRGANCVSRYKKEGAFLGVIKPGREFVMPSDILTLTSGEVVVRDERGLQLFGANLEFVKFLAEEAIDRCFGLAEDDDGRIITINYNAVEGNKDKITMGGMTDIFFIEKISNKVVRRVEMVELIDEAVKELQSLQADMSLCRFLTYCNHTLYVVDMGLDCVFVLNNEETESELFGRRGNQGGEFRDPVGLVLDDVGTMMVVDSRNHRLQLIDRNLNFAGLVKVDIPLARPTGIFLDRVNRDIVVSNYLGKSVVRYKVGQL